MFKLTVTLIQTWLLTKVLESNPNAISMVIIIWLLLAIEALSDGSLNGSDRMEKKILNRQYLLNLLFKEIIMVYSVCRYVAKSEVR